MKINKYFERNFLTVGETYDNWVFENCPMDFLCLARTNLNKINGEVKPCVVQLNRHKEERVEQIFNKLSVELQKKILARDFITSMVMRELLKHRGNKEVETFINAHIQSFVEGDFEKVKELHASSFMPGDIKRFAKELGKIELSFVLEGTQNIYIQQAINVFVSSREPYSVKIFTNNNKLPTYYDLNGNLIECPHDFMRRDVRQFIEDEIDLQSEKQ